MVEGSGRFVAIFESIANGNSSLVQFNRSIVLINRATVAVNESAVALYNPLVAVNQSSVAGNGITGESNRSFVDQPDLGIANN